MCVLVCCTAEESSFFVVAEAEITSELNDFCSALIHLMAAYFIFNLAYPKAMQSLLLFIQHYVFDLQDTQKELAALIEIVSSFRSMDD